MDTFPSIRASRVAACALWIISEYCQTKEEIAGALEVRGRQGAGTGPGCAAVCAWALNGGSLVGLGAGVSSAPREWDCLPPAVAVAALLLLMRLVAELAFTFIMLLVTLLSVTRPLRR